VTNSSSTSFIFFGITFDDSVAEDIFEKITAPEDINKESYADEMAEAVCEWAEGIKGDVSVHIGWESMYGEVYISESCYWLEGGVDNLPLDHILENRGKEEKWTKQLKEFCKKWGITPSASHYNNDDGYPKWKVALEIER
jgi:hypothetical protein